MRRGATTLLKPEDVTAEADTVLDICCGSSRLNLKSKDNTAAHLRSASCAAVVLNPENDRERGRAAPA
ncbi:hypothetical protein SERLADRAFT_471171 [Serpula lacrymans var. lacrymans S7.9]|uniref:Uncharacterized protein n=1 Tax=Serpula lacrymans var. lacrymans (strain S7.9) TaxID=578457 RepID=F8P0T5_SERL9|nr:uncharacterized protein SERLADRAFT_471171 [Serpula lacrymans var. lacrymans S7.9]EGO22769.1 hypothetical protein SERLADRAFT_471171 [Serpula lacrymans var. lacrymans S7.9]